MDRNSLTQIISSSRGSPELLAELQRFLKTLVVMFTDIKGSTAYFEKYGDAAGFLMVHNCNDMLQKIVEAHGGTVVKTIGDAIMATFDDCGQSVRASVEMQRAMVDFNKDTPKEDRVYIRVGLNYGQGIVKSNDVFGDVVNVASRVESAAQPEQIVLSDTMMQQLVGQGFRTAFLGKFALKGKADTSDLYEVYWSDENSSRKATAHTLMMSPKSALVLPKYKAQHVKPNGEIGAEYPFVGGKLLVGRTEGQAQFPNDSTMSPQHAEFVIERGQVFVIDRSGAEGTGVFVRLVTSYPLRDADTIIIGRQHLQFRSQEAAMSAAAALGTSLVDLNEILTEPVAQFIGYEGGKENGRFPLNGNEITWGRTKGTYIFPDDGFMSRSHAKVYLRGEDFFLEDVGSRNGTFIKVRGKAALPADGSVMIGRQLLKVTV
jgi:class 3 adenylate cyclase/pSer/pThr/pTyr-binding forkhead associated (FHA) protein